MIIGHLGYADNLLLRKLSQRDLIEEEAEWEIDGMVSQCSVVKKKKKKSIPVDHIRNDHSLNQSPRG